ncbi:MAG: hypothetical protein RLZZ387_1357 [Chloroflexota bacterium]
MDPLTYLTTPAAGAGAPEWVFFVAQVLVVISGIYLAFMYAEPHPVRGRAVRQLAYALLAVGLVGAVIGALRISGVAPFTAPVWTTIATLFNLVLIGFAVYYARSVLPTAVAAHDQANRTRSTRSTRSQVATSVDAARVARPVAESNGVARPASPPSGRRDSRRDRKRKSR